MPTYVVSTEEYRTAKKNKDDLGQDEVWQCHVCNFYSSEDIDEPMWTNCDQCINTVHVDCVPVAHGIGQDLARKVQLEDYPFICSRCCKSQCCEKVI